jgi:hypothetical protein
MLFRACVASTLPVGVRCQRAASPTIATLQSSWNWPTAQLGELTSPLCLVGFEILRKVMEHLRLSTAGMLCSTPSLPAFNGQPNIRQLRQKLDTDPETATIHAPGDY